MPQSKELFGKRILKINGVKGYILIRDDGRILTSKLNCRKPETMASMMVITGMGSDAIKSAMGFTHYNFLMLTNKHDEMLFVFPVKKYFLGILYGKGEYDAVFVKQVQSFIQDITEKAAAKG